MNSVFGRLFYCCLSACIGGVIVAIILVFTLDKLPQIAVVDMKALAKEYTLTLATSDKSREEIAEEVIAWGAEKNAHLAALAEQYNLVILPAGIGVTGAPNITALLEDSQ